MTEAFLQYVWRHGLLNGPLSTYEGKRIEVRSVGVQNSNAGPDFENAQITIDGIRWAGSVEIHVKASDWNLHNHTSDPAYNNVILHVVYDYDCDVFTASGVKVQVLELRRYIPIELWGKYDTLMNAPVNGRVACADKLGAVGHFDWSALMERMVVERLERKSRMVSQMLEDSKGSWETVFYWLTAHYFGGSANAFPFELLAKSTPLTLVARYKDDRDRIEALLMGQAGLLEEDFEDSYPQRLKSDYQIIRRGYSLTPISFHLWRFFRMRPSSFPTVRISQFASFLSTSKNLFSKLLETERVEDLTAYFDATAAPYWNDHYQFDKPSEHQKKNVGKMLEQTLIINAWVPLLFVYGKHHDREDLCDRAVGLLRGLKPESNNIIRIWKACGVEVRDAADSQALIQLYNLYCQQHRCLDCRIGYLFMKNKD